MTSYINIANTLSFAKLIDGERNVNDHKKRDVFLISDGTGITVESFATSLLSQFPHLKFRFQEFPYTDSPEKVEAIKEKIQTSYEINTVKPLVFLTIVDSKMVPEFKATHAYVFDFFTTMVDSLEQALKTKAIDKANLAHAYLSPTHYDQRINAINYALLCDDGLGKQNYEQADVILIGVSRCGKTPSCIYMALQFGIYAANYPITNESIHDQHLPEVLKKYKQKIFGLTIDPKRLHHIRTERLPNTTYASLKQCEYEVREVESLYQHQHIPFLDSTHHSIEEISTRIMSMMQIKRQI